MFLCSIFTVPVHIFDFSEGWHIVQAVYDKCFTVYIFWIVDTLFRLCTVQQVLHCTYFLWNVETLFRLFTTSVSLFSIYGTYFLKRCTLFRLCTTSVSLYIFSETLTNCSGCVRHVREGEPWDGPAALGLPQLAQGPHLRQAPAHRREASMDGQPQGQLP